MISTEVENLLHRCFVSARQARHEFITVDHMLLEMLNHASVMTHLKARSVDAGALKDELAHRIGDIIPLDAAAGDVDTQPTGEFQRVLQQAIMAVQARGDSEVSLLDLLDAVLESKSSHAAGLLSGRPVQDESACRFCRKSVPRNLLTVVPGRGVICADCIAAIVQASK